MSRCQIFVMLAYLSRVMRDASEWLTSALTRHVSSRTSKNSNQVPRPLASIVPKARPAPLWVGLEPKLRPRPGRLPAGCLLPRSQHCQTRPNRALRVNCVSSCVLWMTFSSLWVVSSRAELCVAGGELGRFNRNPRDPEWQGPPVAQAWLQHQCKQPRPERAPR